MASRVDSVSSKVQSALTMREVRETSADDTCFRESVWAVTIVVKILSWKFYLECLQESTDKYSWRAIFWKLRSAINEKLQFCYWRVGNNTRKIPAPRSRNINKLLGLYLLTFDKRSRPETSFIFLLIGAGIFLCYSISHLIVPHAPECFHSFLLIVTVV